jgi:SPX domain protein involved in polyphosphate accumulation
LINIRLEDYQSLNRHSVIQENTFGNILPQTGVLSPDQLPLSNNETLRAFDSVKLNSSAVANDAKRIEELEAELEELRRKSEKERQELWERVRTLEQDSEAKVRDLVSDNTGLVRQAEHLAQRCKSQQENL